MTTLSGIVGKLFHTARTDFASRSVNNAQKGIVIIRIGEQSQVSHDVLDLGISKEGNPAAEVIGHVMFPQDTFKEAGLVIASIQNGIVRVTATLHETMMDQFRNNLFRFLFFIPGAQNANGIAEAKFAPQLLFEHMGIVSDKAVGGLENTSAGTVILFQLDDL